MRSHAEIGLFRERYADDADAASVNGRRIVLSETPHNGAAPVFSELTGPANPFASAAFGAASRVMPTFVDADGDGDLDLVVGIFSGGNIEYYQRNADDSFTRLTGASNPFDTIDVVFAGAAPAAIDYDRDGDLDLLAGAANGSVILITNGGAGNWTNSGAVLNISPDAYSAPSAADWDGDGDADLVVGGRHSGLFAFRNDGPGNFTALTGANNPFGDITIPEWTTPSFLDFDGDGDPDLLVTAFYDAGAGPVVELRAFRNDAGVFTEVASSPFSGFTFGPVASFAFADLDRDGDLDAVVGSNDGDLRTFRNGPAPGQTVGTPGDDALTGTDGDDLFQAQQGGNDSASGGAGNDGFYFGGAYTSADSVDGGAGNLDQIGLQGDYSGGVTLGTITGVEFIVLLPGNDTRFGDTAGNLYSYNITSPDAAVPAGGILRVQANTLRAGENFTFNGSAETNGSFLIYAGLGTDNLTGGAGNDGFFFGPGRFGSGDVVNGGAGAMDQLALQGDYTGTNRVTFGAGQLSGVEFLVLLSASDNRFGSSGGTVSYNLTMNNGNVAAGQTMVVSANTLQASEFMFFIGAAELDGRFQVFAGAGDDQLVGGQTSDDLRGGAGNDQVEGQGGADQLRGGTGNDTFVYNAASASTAAARDQILDFTTGDLIGLAGIAFNTGGGNFAFIGGSGPSGARQVQVIQAGNNATVNVFIDGDAVADMVIDVTVADGHTLTAADFTGVSPVGQEPLKAGGGAADPVLVMELVGPDLLNLDWIENIGDAPGAAGGYLDFAFARDFGGPDTVSMFDVEMISSNVEASIYPGHDLII